MLIAQLLFYLLALFLVASSIAVVFARHPVHAVLFLILALFNCAGLFLLLGAEFLALVLVIVYVGAVAVFFLFVVMMLDVDFASLRSRWITWAPLGGLVALVLLGEIGFFVFGWKGREQDQGGLAIEGENIDLIASLLYSEYAGAFLISGLILFVAMIGAIVLSLRVRPRVHRQNVDQQVRRSSEVKMVTIKPGEGAE